MELDNDGRIKLGTETQSDPDKGQCKVCRGTSTIKVGRLEYPCGSLYHQ